MREKPDFKTSLLALMEEESMSSHPDAEDLVAHCNGELTSADRARVDRHLASCRECAELASDLDLFNESTAQQDNAFEVAAFLRALKPQLAAEPPAQTSTWYRSLAAAASLILAVAGTWWISADLTRRQMLTESSQPRGNVPIIDVVEDASQRSGRPATVYEIRRDVGGILVFTPDSSRSFAAYEAKILDSDNALVHPVQDLEKDAEGLFIVLIPAGSLDPGSDYRVELYGRSGERAEVIASCRLLVLDEAKASS